MDVLEDVAPPEEPAGLDAGEMSAGLVRVGDDARARGDHAEALSIYDAILNEQPYNHAALLGRAAALRHLGRPREALAALNQTLSHRSDDADARIELGMVLRAMRRRTEARQLFTLLVREAEPPAGAWHGLAEILQADGHDAAAQACLRRAVAIDPAAIDARQQLADLVARQGDLAGAVDLYHDLLSIEPASPAAHAGLGQALVGLGRMDEAEDELERALVLDDENLVARLGRARLRLLEGDFGSAWDDLEWRWQAPGMARPDMPIEAWDGGPLDGQTILVWSEQGLDDTLQLARFLPQLAAMGCRVVLGAPAPLVPLLAALEGVDHVVAAGQPMPAGVAIDLHASLLDLPRLFGTTLSSIPAHIPYLHVPDGRRSPVPAPAAAVLKVGLMWSGARPSWSVPLPQLMPLMGMPRVAFYSLQPGPAARDAAQLSAPCLITDLAASIRDYGDLAARIAQLDLIITVDGPVAHVAGALGKPVLLMLPHAPDWRWMLDREDTPWYPGMRLLRQQRPGDWTGVITRVMGAVEELVAAAEERRAGLTRVNSGPGAQIAAMLAAHLEAGDAFVDVGAGDGTFTLEAAAHPSGDVLVLAIEGKTVEAEHLADLIAVSIAEDVVEVVPTPVAGRTMPVVVARRPRCGRTVFPLPEWVNARSHTVAVDSLLADRPHLGDRRLVVRIGTKTSEAEVLDGLWEALTLQRAAVVVFEHSDGAVAAHMLEQAGYSLHRFPSDIGGGPLRPFRGEPGAVLALAMGVAPKDGYGALDDAGSPASEAAAREEALTLTDQGTQALLESRFDDAADLLGTALALDPTNAQANANMGALLRRAGRVDAAAACWRRALACGAAPSAKVNLAGALRDLGQLAEAEAVYMEVLADTPDAPAALHGLAILARLRGRAKESLALLERAEAVAPGTVPRRELAVALLKSGNLARGMAEMAHRAKPDLPPIPGAAAWHGERLDARSIVVRDEGDAIDTIQLSRFIHQVGRQGGLVTVECEPEVARLMTTLPGVEAVVPRGQPLPPADFQVELLDLPRLIGTTSRTTPPRDVPYLHLPDDVPPATLPDTGRLRVGLAWGGRERDPHVPLSQLLRLAALPDVHLFSLQRGERARDLAATGARAFIDDVGAGCEDLADVAAVIASLDLVVATDAVEAHLAGAMGKPVWVLLPLGNDWRWVDSRDDAVWYPTMRVFRQAIDGSWDHAIGRVGCALWAMAAGKRRR